MGFWEERILGKYLDGLKEIWNCDDEKAMRTLCEAYYFLRGMRPITVKRMFDCHSSKHIEYVFQTILLETHPSEIPILERHREELDRTLNKI